MYELRVNPNYLVRFMPVEFPIKLLSLTDSTGSCMLISAVLPPNTLLLTVRLVCGKSIGRLYGWAMGSIAASKCISIESFFLIILLEIVMRKLAVESTKTE
jgi:hypothetical protein